MTVLVEFLFVFFPGGEGMVLHSWTLEISECEGLFILTSVLEVPKITLESQSSC